MAKQGWEVTGLGRTGEGVHGAHTRIYPVPCAPPPLSSPAHMSREAGLLSELAISMEVYAKKNVGMNFAIVSSGLAWV